MLEDVFESHVGSLISHTSPEQHGYVRTCAEEMLAVVRALPTLPRGAAPRFRLMPQVLAGAA